MMQYMPCCAEYTSASDANFCAPAAFSAHSAAHIAIRMGTVILAVSIFIFVLVSISVLSVLLGVRALMIISLLVLPVLAGTQVNRELIAGSSGAASALAVCAS